MLVIVLVVDVVVVNVKHKLDREDETDRYEEVSLVDVLFKAGLDVVDLEAFT